MHEAHYQHIAFIGISIILILSLFGWRIKRLKDRKDFRIGIRRIIIITLLIGYAGIIRSIAHSQALFSLLSAWFIPLLLSALPSYWAAKQHPATFDVTDQCYLLPPRFYLIILLLLLPYALTTSILLVLHPPLANNMHYLFTTSVIKGLIFGYYIGTLLGLVIHANKTSPE